MSIVFLDIEDVLIVHRNQIQLYGGDFGLRDEGLLRSAIGTVRASFGGQWLHEFPHGMAAAYLFHICSNHPFVDGNKRAAFASALAFLDLNGCDLHLPLDAATEFVLKIARGEVEKAAVLELMRKHVIKR
ncbi:MAG: type II toxin-antitoxin system death-on-curing family toxin [Tepidisphaeraceae bacterium]